MKKRRGADISNFIAIDNIEDGIYDACVQFGWI